MVLKDDKFLCYLFLLAFLALTEHKPQWILKLLDQLTNRDVSVKIFNIFKYEEVSYPISKHR